LAELLSRHEAEKGTETPPFKGKPQAINTSNQASPTFHHLPNNATKLSIH
jgi:hypothetical protein